MADSRVYAFGPFHYDAEQRIVADLPYADSSVQSIDLTEMLLDWLKADERTRTIVRGLK
jgi:hypothetical protein